MDGNINDMEWILNFVGNEDMICPIFNMIIDESWGLGNGEDWEQGCRSNIRL